MFGWKWEHNRKALNSIMYGLKTGCRYRDIPQATEYAAASTAYYLLFRCRSQPMARRPDGVTVSSRPSAVVEVNHAVAETAFVQQFELQADVVGQGSLAASHYHRYDEQVTLVDQPALERLCG